MIDFEVQRCTRRCATTGRELAPGEEFFSTLVVKGADVTRLDYSLQAWQGPPEGILGWWRSQMPTPHGKKVHWAPNDVMLQLLEQLEHQPDKQDLRYVLALLLIRRRVVRLEETLADKGGETLVLYCPRLEATFRVATADPSEERTNEIQQELSRLLFADAA